VQAGTLAWIAVGPGTSLHGTLFVSLGWAEPVARGADLALAACAAVGGLLVLLSAARASGWRTAGAVLSAGAFGTVALTDTLAGGHPFAGLSVPALATRWLAPLALVRSPERVLRVAAALTLAAHGVAALGAHPLFVDLVLGSLRTLRAPRPSEATVVQVVALIGVLDLAVAAGLLLRRWSGLAAWAALWGLATALSRPIALGPDFAFEATLRAMNACAPAALWLAWRAPRPRVEDSGIGQEGTT